MGNSPIVKGKRHYTRLPSKWSLDPRTKTEKAQDTQRVQDMIRHLSESGVNLSDQNAKILSLAANRFLAERRLHAPTTKQLGRSLDRIIKAIEAVESIALDHDFFSRQALKRAYIEGGHVNDEYQADIAVDELCSTISLPLGQLLELVNQARGRLNPLDRKYDSSIFLLVDAINSICKSLQRKPRLSKPDILSLCLGGLGFPSGRQEYLAELFYRKTSRRKPPSQP